MKQLATNRFLGGTALAVIIAAGIFYNLEHSHAATSPVANPAIPVVVQTLTPQKVQVWTEFSGRLHAVDSAEIRPEVGGRITEVRFQDGGLVKTGDILLVIDPRPYEAAVAKAEAALATAKTNADFAKIELDRAAGMIKTQAIAQRIYDERANSGRIADAAVKSAQAELKQANLDLEYAYVRAPISGRVGRAELTVGNVVQAGNNAPLLTTIVANDTIYADFEVDEQTYMQSIRGSSAKADEERHIPVQLTVQGDKGHSYQGTIYSFDNKIDIASGTIRARAKFNNADGALMPGMFVSVNLASGTENTALLVPEQALGFDQSKKFVYVVGKDNKVAYHEVELGKEVQSQRIVLHGLAAGDRVIVDGLQHVRPDAVVDAKEQTSEVTPPLGKDSLAQR